MSDALLKVEDLKVAYGGIHAVKGINLEVKQGELVALSSRCRSRIEPEHDAAAGSAAHDGGIDRLPDLHVCLSRRRRW